MMLFKVNSMEYSLSLIDKAGEICGSFYKLSKALSVSESNIASVRAKRRALPLEWVPELAEIVGVDAREALACVMAERLPEGSRARAILGGAQAAFVAAMLLFFVSLGLLQPLTGYAAETRKVNPLYIVEYWLAILCVFFMARGEGPGRRTHRPRTMMRQAYPVQRPPGRDWCIG